MPAVTIRPAQPADVPLILALVRELAEYEREPESAVATDEQVRHALFSPASNDRAAAGCLIAELDGAPQGFALYFHNFSTWTGRSGLYLEDLFVRPAARAHGLGKRLMIELARLAIARGCARFEWSVLDWNTPAIDFYRALGAVRMDEWTVHRLSGEALRALATAGGDQP